MAKGEASLSLISCVIVLLLSQVGAITYGPQEKQVYIVYMGSLPSRPKYAPMSHHISILQEVTAERYEANSFCSHKCSTKIAASCAQNCLCEDSNIYEDYTNASSSSIENRLVRSYKRSFNGFAARLTESERERIAEMEGVVSVFPNKVLHTQTTSSWDFMGLKEGNNAKRNVAIESDIVVGVIDSGIWPEVESFSDKGFGPLPKKWKGVCSGGNNFTCNNKLIGARDYTSEGTRDKEGHGTHTASTSAGNAVPNTSFFGIGNGTARGGVPAARIAAYKVCTVTGCTLEAVLAAFDDAIADGVDLITISLGGTHAFKYEVDTVAIGAFHAMTKGILTVQAAGNGGPYLGTVGSVAPWILTVAAGSTNREFITKVVLDNGKILTGKSVNAFDLKGKNYPFINGSYMNRYMLDGKILVSTGTFGSEFAVATVTENYKSYASVSSRPLSALSNEDINWLNTYINSAKSPQGTVLKTEAKFDQKAPKIVSFSSRGPNNIAVDLLKPDITAPGVEILAAYSPLASPSSDESDKRHVKYSVLSGTSMACPHVTGVAAYIKTFHPDWSPSAIHSAIMTTAWAMNASETGYATTEFAYGAGHVDPIAALNPGLVYELVKADYIDFLCGLNYTSKTLKLISGEAATCTEKTLPRNLNYPSMSAKLPGSNSSFTVTFERTVTNVGTPNSTYKSRVFLNHGSKLNVKVSPSVLTMKSFNEKHSFTVTVTSSNLNPKLPSSAHLIWSDGTHNVRSPIVVYAETNNVRIY